DPLPPAEASAEDLLEPARTTERRLCDYGPSRGDAGELPDSIRTRTREAEGGTGSRRRGGPGEPTRAGPNAGEDQEHRRHAGFGRPADHGEEEVRSIRGARGCGGPGL